MKRPTVADGRRRAGLSLSVLIILDPLAVSNFSILIFCALCVRLLLAVTRKPLKRQQQHQKAATESSVKCKSLDRRHGGQATPAHAPQKEMHKNQVHQPCRECWPFDRRRHRRRQKSAGIKRRRPRGRQHRHQPSKIPSAECVLRRRPDGKKTAPAAFVWDRFVCHFK